MNPISTVKVYSSDNEPIGVIFGVIEESMNLLKSSVSSICPFHSPQKSPHVNSLEEKFKLVDDILDKKSLSPSNIQTLMGFVKLIRSIELSDGDEDIMDTYDNYIESIEDKMTNVFFYGQKKQSKLSLQLI